MLQALTQEAGHLWPLIYRTVIMYVVILVVIRLMGKRSLANMAPFDLVVILIIGEAAAIPMQEVGIPLLHGIVPILLLAALEFAVSLANLYSKRFEDLTQGRATLLVKNGRMLYRGMRREHVTEADLISLLRDKGIDHLEAVREAWLEPNGTMSVIPTVQEQPVNLRQLKKTVSTEEFEKLLDEKLAEFRRDILSVLNGDRRQRIR